MQEITTGAASTWMCLYGCSMECMVGCAMDLTLPIGDAAGLGLGLAGNSYL